MNRLSQLVVVLALVAIGTGIYLWLRPQSAPEPSIAQAPPATAESTEPLPAPPLLPRPEIQYPITPPAASREQDPSAPPDIGVAMTGLVGRDTVLALFNLDQFVRRAVVTVDNLARPHAAPTLWPVNPTPGRFEVAGAAPGEHIAPDNYARYQRFAAMAARIDTERAVALYKQLYPQFQKAYEELGYPRSYFNDRLVAVIDNLLATPEPGEPVTVSRPQVKGPVELQRPWVRYEYAEPELESLSAGQKMLLRMGPENRRMLKAKLMEIRRAITRQAIAQ